MSDACRIGEHYRCYEWVDDLCACRCHPDQGDQDYDEGAEGYGAA